jgi:hypothetical protein
MTAAITLNEAAKLALNDGDTKRAGVISLYSERSDVLQAMRFEGITGSAITFNQEGDLPASGSRGINEGFTADAGNFNPQKEALYLFGGDLDVDRFLIKTMGMEVRTRHEALKVKALAQDVTDVIIKGDNSSDPRDFDGLQSRLTAGALVANGSTSGGDVLSLAKLDSAIDNTADPTHLIMSRAQRLLFQAAYRSSTFPNIMMSMDDMGKNVLSYGGLPILVGYPKNQNTAILPYTEANPGGGSAVGTSIYVVNFGEDGVVGISNGGIDVRDLGELNTLPVWRTRVEWYLSMVIYGKNSATRLWGVKTGAIVA